MLRVGSSAPDFKLRLDSGELVRLHSLKGKQPIVLLFLPGAHTLDTAKEGYSLLQHLQQADALGAKVIAVSPSKLDDLQEFARLYHAPLGTAWDETREVCRRYRVMWLGGSAVRRTTYVVDKSSVVRACLHHELLPDKHWNSVARALRALNDEQNVPLAPEKL